MAFSFLLGFGLNSRGVWQNHRRADIVYDLALLTYSSVCLSLGTFAYLLYQNMFLGSFRINPCVLRSSSSTSIWTIFILRKVFSVTKVVERTFRWERDSPAIPRGFLPKRKKRGGNVQRSVYRYKPKQRLARTGMLTEFELKGDNHFDSKQLTWKLDRNSQQMTLQRQRASAIQRNMKSLVMIFLHTVRLPTFLWRAFNWMSWANKKIKGYRGDTPHIFLTIRHYSFLPLLWHMPWPTVI